MRTDIFFSVCNMQLAVFILSSIAVILCAAGMFHALEESYYISNNETFQFHEALYFVLVTTATIGKAQ